MYFLQRSDETLEETVETHGGLESGYSTLNSAKRDLISVWCNDCDSVTIWQKLCDRFTPIRTYSSEELEEMDYNQRSLS